MGSTDRSRHHHSRSGEHRHEASDELAGDRPSPQRGGWRRWRVEIISILLVGLGVFLLVEPFEIRKTVFDWLGRAGAAVADWLGTVNGRVTGLHASDIVGLVFLFVGLGLVIYRVRVHLRNRLRWNLLDTSCPKCGAPLKMGHRDERDHYMAWFVGLKLRRYKCGKCKWTGLGAKRPTSGRSRRRRRIEEALEHTPVPRHGASTHEGQSGSHDDVSDDGEEDGELDDSPDSRW